MSSEDLYDRTLVTGSFYHIYNRGVAKQEIFKDERDYSHFLLCLSHYLEQEPVQKLSYLLRQPKAGKTLSLAVDMPLVRVHAYCLMPNHFHLLLEQIEENGISLFMNRIGIGFTKFFNKRYDRSGALFGGTFKAKVVNDDSYLFHLSRYIHLNPVSLLTKSDNTNPVDYLSDYYWSSYNDYAGRRTFPFITKELIQSEFRDSEEYIKFMKNWKTPVDEQISHLYFDE